MNTRLLQPDIQEYLREHMNADIPKLLLKGSPFESVTVQELAQQLVARNKCKEKLPTWFATPGIYYPAKLNMEQTSSESTAVYKADLVQGERLVDLTGGFGVDSYFFSKRFQRLVHCEMDPELSGIAAHNFKAMGIENCHFHKGDGIQLLRDSEQKYDWIYVDPSRRNSAKGKVFQLSDCLPELPLHLPLLFDRAPNILIKTAPLLDLTMGLSELLGVAEIHIVAVANEVKEVLWLLRRHFKGDVMVRTINLLGPRSETFDFLWSEEKEAPLSPGMPDTYLYEPNAAILKAGAFKTMANRLNVKKLHINSHLYSSGQLLEFPGRRFRIIRVLPYNRKALSALDIKKANITTRNFPETVASLRSKFKIADGGNNFLFFTTNMEQEKVVLVCEKI